MKTVHVPLQAGPKWAALYKAGALCAALYIVFGIIVPAILYATSGFDAGSDGREVLNFIAAHRVWWIAEQTLVLAPSVFAIVTFIALYPALNRSNATLALIAVAGAVVSQILFMAYFPIVMGLVELSDNYLVAAADETRRSLVAAADCLVAQNASIGPSEAILAVSVVLLSVVMFKSDFHRVVAYTGIATGVAYVIGMVLRPTVGVVYLTWWAFFLIWFGLTGWRLLTVGVGIDRIERAAATEVMRDRTG